jgi:DNA mismatch repair protein MutS2
MDAHTLKVLEYHKITGRLADHCACSLGRRRAEALKPRSDLAWVRARLEETSQARRALQDEGHVPFGGLTDIGELLSRARAGRMLDGHEVLQVAAAARAGRLVGDYFARAAEVAPDLAALADRLGTYEELEAEVERRLDEEGQVREDASDTLVGLRRREGVLRERIQHSLESIADEAVRQGRARERLIVQRSGRYCIPIRAQEQSRFPGIVHDRSDSGATVFIEPQTIVERGNELRDTELAIEEEIKRILRELSGLIGSWAEPLERDQRTLGVLDFIVAKAGLAGQMGATHPRVRDDRTFDLRAARHPLLTGEVVPVNVWAGEDFATLVITGPNTGGKTVALKTMGLLTLMAQSGMHVPADAGTEIAVFDSVFADIGDEQSIEQSLSTFSSHMTQIVKVLQRVEADRRRAERHGQDGHVNTLVLLDEIGAGTDPTEGAALAQAILEELHAAGCVTIATTHYNDLKVFAYATEGVENASVEFDVRTLAPTYHLRIGHPGSSNALQIARRLGLPRRITRRGAQFLDEDEVAFEDLLRQLEGSRRALDRQRAETSRTRADLEELRQEHEEPLEQLRGQEEQALEEGFEEALEVVREAEEEARAIIAELQRQPRQSKVTEQGRQRLAQTRREMEEKLQAVRESRQAEAEPEQAEEPAPEAELHAGDLVHVTSLARDGRVTRVLEDGTAQVQVGGMTVEARAAELAPPKEPPSEEAQRLAEAMRVRKSLTFADEIDIRGMTVDEAISALGKYLDDAMLAGASRVRIIHGKGTGALREGVHEFLARHKYVSSFALADLSEGGAGATEVRL